MKATGANFTAWQQMLAELGEDRPGPLAGDPFAYADDEDL